MIEKKALKKHKEIKYSNVYAPTDLIPNQLNNTLL